MRANTRGSYFNLQKGQLLRSVCLDPVCLPLTLPHTQAVSPWHEDPDLGCRQLHRHTPWHARLAFSGGHAQKTPLETRALCELFNAASRSRQRQPLTIRECQTKTWDCPLTGSGLPGGRGLTTDSQSQCKATDSNSTFLNRHFLLQFHRKNRAVAENVYLKGHHFSLLPSNELPSTEAARDRAAQLGTTFPSLPHTP